MNRVLAIIGGVGAGVAAAYFLDPKKGADRRAMVADRFNTLKQEATQKISDATESFRQQANGFADDAKAMVGDGSSQSVAGASQSRHSNQNENKSHSASQSQAQPNKPVAVH